MNRKLSLFFLLSSFSLFLHSCKHDKTEQVFKYPNGVVSRRIPMVDEKKHGELLEYYSSGELKSRSEFVNDQQTGKTMYYYKSGKVQEIQYFNNSKLILGDTTFYENGNIEFIAEYTNGYKNGYIKKFDSTGTMYFNARYRMDTLVEVKGVPLQR